MKNIIIVIFAILLSCIAAQAQNAPSPPSPRVETGKKAVFRPTKVQIVQVQKMLKTPETGKIDAELRDEIKKYQSENGLKATGTLNRATLEKMGVKLTEKQKEFPIDPDSFENKDENKSPNPTKKASIFYRAKERLFEI